MLTGEPIDSTWCSIDSETLRIRNITMMENDIFYNNDSNQQEEIRVCSEDDNSSTTPSEPPSEHGVLILPAAIQAQRDELSYPDTVPSDLDSVLLLREDRNAAHPLWQQQQQQLLLQRAHSGSRASSLHSNAVFRSRNEQVPLRQLRESDPSNTFKKNHWIMIVVAALLFIVLVAFCTVTTVLLLQEREHRRLESQLLRDEILRLQEFTRAAVQATPPSTIPPTIQIVQKNPSSKLQDITPPKANYTPPPPKVKPTKLPWEGEASCREGKKTIIDNCWVHAKADFELGECARKTKRSLTRKARKIGKSLLNTKNKLWKQAEDWLKRNLNSVDSTEESHTPPGDHIKTILKGVAFATLVTAIADTAFGWFSGDESS